jgi:hypothetical protein
MARQQLAIPLSLVALTCFESHTRAVFPLLPSFLTPASTLETVGGVA